MDDNKSIIEKHLEKATEAYRHLGDEDFYNDQLDHFLRADSLFKAQWEALGGDIKALLIQTLLRCQTQTELEIERIRTESPIGIKSCAHCGGSGRIYEPDNSTLAHERPPYRCQRCNGTGLKPIKTWKKGKP